MPGARRYEDVASYESSQGLSLDDRGYVLSVDGSDQLQLATDGDNPFAVNYVSTEDQDGVVQTLDAGDELDTVRHSPAFEVRCDDETYALDAPVYISDSNDGHVNQSNTTGSFVGRVVKAVDHSGASGNNQHVLVAFSFDSE